MAARYVSMEPEPNGEHEVHASGCRRLPDFRRRIYLGDYLCCRRAMTEAGNYYRHVNGCPACCHACYSECSQAQSDV
jgi:hypothetical protein